MPKLGAAHHNAKLNDAQVRDMRTLYESWKAAKSSKGYGALAQLFGCGESTARDIVTYRTRYAVTYQPDDYDLTQRDELHWGSL